jgi:hypothetical protein
LPCGRHESRGRPWREALAREVQYLEQAVKLPLLNSPGHTVGELLAAREALAAGKKNPA